MSVMLTCKFNFDDFTTLRNQRNAGQNNGYSDR